MSRSVIRVAVLGMGLVMAGLSLADAAQAASERIDRWFVFGTNLAWFGNSYGADLGPNHAEGGWKPSFDRDECERVFANLARMGCPVVRIWAMERQEGLTFTADLTTDPKWPYHEVTGLDAQFLENCDTLMAIAERHRVMVYWTLLNHLIREEQGGRHLRIITDPKVRRTFIENAAVPFVKRYAERPAFFAVDIINEADGAVGRADAATGCFRPLEGCTWAQMREFIRDVARAIHQECPGVKVTASSGWHGWKNVKAGRFSGLGLDFYDFHVYDDRPNLPHARELGLDRPVLVGEIGPKTERPDAGYQRQGENWTAFFEQARKGYAGVLSWSYGKPGAENNFVMVEADHSWRSGAKVMHRYAQGDLFPDAGPLLLTPSEREELATINRLARMVIDAASVSRLGGGDAGVALAQAARDARRYHPYLNPKYARLALGRLVGGVLTAIHATGAASSSPGSGPAAAAGRQLAADLWRTGADNPQVAANRGMIRLSVLAGLGPVPGADVTPIPPTIVTPASGKPAVGSIDNHPFGD